MWCEKKITEEAPKAISYDFLHAFHNAASKRVCPQICQEQTSTSALSKIIVQEPICGTLVLDDILSFEFCSQ